MLKKTVLVISLSFSCVCFGFALPDQSDVMQAISHQYIALYHDNNSVSEKSLPMPHDSYQRDKHLARYLPAPARVMPLPLQNNINNSTIATINRELPTAVPSTVKTYRDNRNLHIDTAILQLGTFALLYETLHIAGINTQVNIQPQFDRQQYGSYRYHRADLALAYDKVFSSQPNHGLRVEYNRKFFDHSNEYRNPDGSAMLQLHYQYKLD